MLPGARVACPVRIIGQLLIFVTVIQAAAIFCNVIAVSEILLRLFRAAASAYTVQKVVVSRRRDGSLSKRVASRVDETTPDFGNVRIA